MFVCPAHALELPPILPRLTAPVTRMLANARRTCWPSSRQHQSLSVPMSGRRTRSSARRSPDGLLRSEVIRRLVDVIDASDVIVYLARGDCPSRAIACLMVAGGGPDVRYVRINFRLPIGLGQARRLAQGRSVSCDRARTAACRRNRRVAGGRRRREPSGRLYPARSRSRRHAFGHRCREKPETTAAQNCCVAVVDRSDPSTAKSSHEEARPAPLLIVGQQQTCARFRSDSHPGFGFGLGNG